ncbi:DUF4041 domain-containing protein [Corynebacterium sp. NPDC060344]|uniref:DUF4041 domain-containing protein n=1 Tax=Corynebacterium sp. NPDC060344 TaxID=3347101 RepID=UPI003649B6E4
MSSIEDAVVEKLEAENRALIAEIDRLRSVNDPGIIEVGYYSYSHRLDSAASYKERLTGIQDEIKAQIKSGIAIEAAEGFIYNNSLAKGRRMVQDLSKLMLRAYNAEAENCVRVVRASSLSASIKRLDRCVAAIEKQGVMMGMKIAHSYHQLRIVELELTVDYLMKKEEEKEAAREERARLREQRRVEAELAAQREKLQKEREHYSNVLASLDEGHPDRAQYEVKLSRVDKAIEENDYRINNARAGYVYVISNIGAFGPGVIKIGMTRRLDPMDRVHELGDASVPFKFDVHALFFSENASGVESELHRRFAERRVNRVNLRREFFYATPIEVQEELLKIDGSLLSFVVEPEAEQFVLSNQIRKRMEERSGSGLSDVQLPISD